MATLSSPRILENMRCEVTVIQVFDENMTFKILDAEAEDEKAQQDDLIPENAATSPVAYSQKSVKSGRTEAKRSITPPDGLISSLGLSSFLRCPCVCVCEYVCYFPLNILLSLRFITHAST